MMDVLKFELNNNRGRSRNLSRGGGVIKYVMLNVTIISHKSECNKFIYNNLKGGVITLLPSLDPPLNNTLMHTKNNSEW